MQITTSKKSTKSLNPIQRYWQFVTSENFGHAGPYPVLHPDVFWYRLYGMGAQKNVPKKVLVTHFPYIFHVKT